MVNPDILLLFNTLNDAVMTCYHNPCVYHFLKLSFYSLINRSITTINVFIIFFLSKIVILQPYKSQYNHNLCVYLFFSKLVILQL